MAGLSDITLQTVPLRESIVVSEQSFFGLDGDAAIPFTYGTDYMFVGNPSEKNFELRAPIVFAGFGISDLETGWDDYEGLNVDGKVVAVLYGTPTGVNWSNDKIDYYTTWGDYKMSNAMAHGAVGLLIVWTDSINKSFPWHFFARENSKRYDWLDENGKPAWLSTRNYYLGGLNKSGMLKLLSADSKLKLQDHVGLSEAYNQGLKFNILPDTVTIKISSRHNQKKSYNVIGRIAGGRGANDNLVITAHMDGKGTFHERSGDTIRNGAIDNAAGVAVLLEMARAIANQPKKQLRNILFVATSGGETGLIGASYFVNNFKEGKIIGAINIDEPAILFRPKTIVAKGAEDSSLKAVINLSAKKLDFRTVGDPWPSEHLFIRGDSYEFVKAGIPAVWLMSGLEARDKSINGEQILIQWRQNYYHQASDDMYQSLNFEACAEFANLNLLIALTIANDPMKPTWNENDFFSKTFGQDQ
jgi:hypothetical protein